MDEFLKALEGLSKAIGEYIVHQQEINKRHAIKLIQLEEMIYTKGHYPLEQAEKDYERIIKNDSSTNI